MSEDETRAVLHCEHCKGPMPGKPHGSYQNVSPGGSWWGEEYTLMECVGCHNPFVVKSSSPDLDDFGQYDDDLWTIPRQVLPVVDEVIDDSVPTAIAKNYLEARRSLRGQNLTAVVLVCRRTVEGICKHFNADGNSLDKKLKDLQTKLIIDERLYNWANHVLRYLGNKGAHDVDEEIEPEDAADAVEFTKAIIWYLFVFDSAFSRHMERRPAKTPVAP